ncbi:hypothetical protein [Fodinibius halophilus]|uniref:Uncharacterized protein n=1 Tax=Fodinibius halophilus TaxID=1736908 RepID=A0A6M1TDS7_9BACT|nr:hypothetical protein [Fodinibius halophilus]NGP90171.1 hypothetical protein [Fodinibius halophilus]
MVTLSFVNNINIPVPAAVAPSVILPAGLRSLSVGVSRWVASLQWANKSAGLPRFSGCHFLGAESAPVLRLRFRIVALVVSSVFAAFMGNLLGARAVAPGAYLPFCLARTGLISGRARCGFPLFISPLLPVSSSRCPKITSAISGQASHSPCLPAFLWLLFHLQTISTFRRLQL